MDYRRIYLLRGDVRGCGKGIFGGSNGFERLGMHYRAGNVCLSALARDQGIHGNCYELASKRGVFVVSLGVLVYNSCFWGARREMGLK